MQISSSLTSKIYYNVLTTSEHFRNEYKINKRIDISTTKSDNSTSSLSHE